MDLFQDKIEGTAFIDLERTLLLHIESMMCDKWNDRFVLWFSEVQHIVPGYMCILSLCFNDLVLEIAQQSDKNDQSGEPSKMVLFGTLLWIWVSSAVLIKRLNNYLYMVFQWDWSGFILSLVQPKSRWYYLRSIPMGLFPRPSQTSEIEFVDIAFETRGSLVQLCKLYFWL